MLRLAAVGEFYRIAFACWRGLFRSGRDTILAADCLNIMFVGFEVLLVAVRFVGDFDYFLFRNSLKSKACCFS